MTVEIGGSLDIQTSYSEETSISSYQKFPRPIAHQSNRERQSDRGCVHWCEPLLRSSREDSADNGLDSVVSSSTSYKHRMVTFVEQVISQSTI